MSREQKVAAARRLYYGAVGVGGLELGAVAGAEAVEHVVRLVRLPAQEREPNRIASAGSIERTRARVEAALMDPDELIGSVRRGGSSVGVVWVRLHWGRVSGALCCHLQELVLDPAARGQGHGFQLMGHLESVFAAAGALELTLNHMTANARAASFYRRCGFRQVGYDLSKPVSADPRGAMTSALDSCRPARPEEAGRVVELIIEGQLLCRFQRFEPDPAELLAEVRAACGQRQVLVTERGRELDGVCWFTCEDSRLTGKPLWVVQALGGAVEDEGVAALLDAVLLQQYHPGLSEILVTLWQPSPALLEGVLARGYKLGRAKLSKALNSGACPLPLVR